MGHYTNYSLRAKNLESGKKVTSEELETLISVGEEYFDCEFWEAKWYNHESDMT